MAKSKKSLSEAVSSELKSGFSLDNFKTKKGLTSSVKFKDQEWIPLSPAFTDVLSIPGIPLGHIVLLRGHSDTGKTTALLETAVASQKRKILPVSIKSNKNNNEWNAGAMSTQFGNSVNQRITLSRKESSQYTNSLVCTNKVWAAKAAVPMGQPKMMNKGGFAMWFDATFVVTFGNIADSGTSKIKAIKDGKQVEFAKRTNVQIDKNHINGVQTRGKIVTTPHGFINDSDKDLKNYKNTHTKEWAEILGGGDFTIIEEDESETGISTFIKEPE